MIIGRQLSPNGQTGSSISPKSLRCLEQRCGRCWSGTSRSFPRSLTRSCLRKAQKRTSLAIKLGDIQTHRLDETTQAAGSNDQQRLLFIGECSFTNERNFPIALQAQQLTVRFAAGTKDTTPRTRASAATSRPPTPGKDTGGVNAFQIQWSDDIEIDYDTAFGPVNEGRNATILEPRGRNVIPLYVPVTMNWKPSESRRLVEIDMDFVIYGVDPETSEEIEGSRVVNRLAHRMFVDKAGGSRRVARTSRRR